MFSAAIVARTNFSGLEYLKRSGDRFDWATTERDADIFGTVRDATRTALALPSKFRAVAIPVRTNAD